MYKDFDERFHNISDIYDEIHEICMIEDDTEAIVRAFHFQRYYALSVYNKNYVTGYEAIRITLSNIRYFIGNGDPKISQRINYLWGNIPH